jgi:hypothetical protein
MLPAEKPVLFADAAMFAAPRVDFAKVMLAAFTLKSFFVHVVKLVFPRNRAAASWAPASTRSYFTLPDSLVPFSCAFE